jgi:HK97 family phage portal protein
VINQFVCGTNGDAFEVTNQVSGLRAPADWLYDWISGGGKSDAGVSVNGYTALTHCPLWQGVNIIAGDMGQVPVRLIRDEFDEQRSHPAWSLLRTKPNRMQTPSVFKETLIQWALIWGNGIAWIRFEGSRPAELIPLCPDCIWPETLQYQEELVTIYHYSSPTTGKQYTFMPYELLHIQGLTSDGVWGYPLWQIGKNTIGHGLALQKHGNTTFANGAVPSGVLEAPPEAAGISKNPEARKNLREEWNAVHRGPDKAGAIAILWEGIKYHQTSASNVESQWLDAMKFDVYQAAALLNLPPHRLGAMQDSSVRANLEEQNQTYKQMTLTRWANRLDEECRRKLLTEKEWLSDRYRFVFDWDTFLQADIDTRTQVADRNVKATIWNPNEARRYLGFPPREGGEEYGSPAINPKRPEDGKESPDNGRPANAVAIGITAHKELILDRVLHLLECESSRLRHAAKNASRGVSNFVQWVDAFYLGSDDSLSTLVDSICGASINACAEAGLDARGVHSAVASYAKTRHKQCLDACEVPKEELQAAIEKVIGSEQHLIAQGLLATAIGGAT